MINIVCATLIGYIVETEIVKKFIKCEFNVPYGLENREKFDIIGIDLPQGEFQTIIN